MKRINLEDLTEEDLLWWLRAKAAEGNGYVPSDSFEDLAKGLFALFRLSPGVLAVRVNEHPGHRELDIGDLAGAGVIRNLPEIIEQCKALGRNLGCDRLVTRVHRRGLRRAYERQGVKTVGWCMELKL